MRMTASEKITQKTTIKTAYDLFFSFQYQIRNTKHIVKFQIMASWIPFHVAP